MIDDRCEPPSHYGCACDTCARCRDLEAQLADVLDSLHGATYEAAVDKEMIRELRAQLAARDAALGEARGHRFMYVEPCDDVALVKVCQRCGARSNGHAGQEPCPGRPQFAAHSKNGDSQ